MRKVSYIFLLALLLAACGGWRDGDRLLSEADGLLYSHPDSAQRLLDSIPDGDLARMSQAQRMRYELLRADAQNKRYVKFTTDSVLKEVVEYYDRKGTANERMRANYLLGRAYYDMGETPMALKYYHEAADHADTTQADCDYKLLSRVHGQMGVLFLDCCSPQNAIEEYKKAKHYSIVGRDTLSWISCIGRMSSAFEYMNMPDSAIYYALLASDLYKRHGYVRQSKMSLGSIIDLLVLKGEHGEAEHAIIQYESVPGLFDSNQNIQEGREIFYYSKGLYFQGINSYDSALYYYHKLVGNARNANHYECGYKGLSEVYQQTGKKDSALYYSRLAYIYNDSCQLMDNTADFQRNQAMYSYSRNQQLADRRAKEVRTVTDYLMSTIAVSVILILLLTIILMWASRKRGELRRLKKEIAECYVSLQQSRFELSGLLEETDLQKDSLENEKASLTMLDSDLMSESESLRKSIKELIGKVEKSYSEKEQELQERVRETQALVKRQEADLERFRDNASLRDRIHFESQLTEGPVVLRFKDMCTRHETPTYEDWSKLRSHLEIQMPSFFPIITGGQQPISTDEMKVCMLIRLHFTLPEIKYLLNRDSANLTTMRGRLIKKIYGINEGGAPDFDRMIMSIC